MTLVGALESPFRRALVPLDGSRVAEAILPAFLPMARPLKIDVMLVRVVVPTGQAAAVDETPEAIEAMEHAREQRRREADEYLRAVAAMPLFDGLQVSTMVRTGQAPEQIREQDEKHGRQDEPGRDGSRDEDVEAAAREDERLAQRFFHHRADGTVGYYTSHQWAIARSSARRSA